MLRRRRQVGDQRRRQACLPRPVCRPVRDGTGRRDGTSRRRQAGFTLVEVLIAVTIATILGGMVMTMIRSWSKAAAQAALKVRRAQAESDLRRLYVAYIATHPSGGFPVLDPWPKEVPGKTPVPWPRPAPGFEQLRFAPSTNPTHLQFQVESWSTGFNVSAIGDLDKNGALELYRIWGDVGMYEGPLPYPPPEAYSPIVY